MIAAILLLAQSFEPHNAVTEAVAFKGKAGIKVTAAPNTDPNVDHLVIAKAAEFSNGVIEVDVAGEPAPGAGSAARGFAGVAFRVQPDRKTYDCFYIRPTNGRAEDQERRNHAVQYVSHPQFTWSKLRQETPSRYEAYADMLHAARILERWEEHVCFKTWVADYKLQVLRDLYKAAARHGWSWY